MYHHTQDTIHIPILVHSVKPPLVVLPAAAAATVARRSMLLSSTFGRLTTGTAGAPPPLPTPPPTAMIIPMIPHPVGHWRRAAVRYDGDSFVLLTSPTRAYEFCRVPGIRARASPAGRSAAAALFDAALSSSVKRGRLRSCAHVPITRISRLTASRMRRSARPSPALLCRRRGPVAYGGGERTR